MRVIFKQEKTRLIIEFFPSKEDKAKNPKTSKGVEYSMRRNRCYFQMPKGWEINSTHPDLLIASAIMIVEPYTAREIIVEVPVSVRLQSEFRESLGKEIRSTRGSTKPREAPSNSVAGLAYSGGVDSTVAALLMPKASQLVFLNRDARNIEKPGLYRNSAALHACERMAALGHKVTVIDTDFEFVRDPVGFAWGISSAVPLLLLADLLNINSVAFGMILESAYRIGDINFRNPTHKFRKILTAAGLPYSLVTGGLSEVATTKIILNNPKYNEFTQSCVRGEVGRPCGRCIKCVRKSMLETKLKGRNIDGLDLESKMVLPEVANHISNLPIHHENIYAYSLEGYSGKSKLLKLFARKVRTDTLALGWMDNWYSPSLELIEQSHRNHVSSNIKRILKPMSASEEEVLRNWQPNKIKEAMTLEGYRYRSRHRKFVKYLRRVQSKELTKIPRK